LSLNTDTKYFIQFAVCYSTLDYSTLRSISPSTLLLSVHVRVGVVAVSVVVRVRITTVSTVAVVGGVGVLSVAEVLRGGFLHAESDEEKDEEEDAAVHGWSREGGTAAELCLLLQY
ncbi:hypothetical protein PENTCL1PPCAC_695, partial [Pristionchus entomophagus]